MSQESVGRNPKSGPRKVLHGDNDRYNEGWDRIFHKNKPEEPICPLCSGKAVAGTCPCCN